jgi:hypothetical protein
MNDLECPYCDAPNEVCHDDGQGYEEGKAHEMTCGDCGKNFVFHTAISFNYTPEKADCLNGYPHRFREWRTLWEHEGKTVEDRRCMDCDHNERRTVPVSSANVEVSRGDDTATPTTLKP